MFVSRRRAAERGRLLPTCNASERSNTKKHATGYKILIVDALAKPSVQSTLVSAETFFLGDPMLLVRWLTCWLFLAAVAMAQQVPGQGFQPRTTPRNSAFAEPRPGDLPEYDVCVYGGTPGGIAAALSAAKSGQKVILLEPTNRIGGLVTSGLSHTDFHSHESLTGSFLDFATRVEAYYTKEYGADSPQVKACFRGTFAEPKINEKIFAAMLAEYPRIHIVKDWGRIANARSVTLPDQLKTLQAIQSAKRNQTREFVTARVFIDASYEGDLLAAAGVPFHVGREARAKYNESLAPEAEDQQLQAYNFRWCMTKEPANRVTPVAPPGYQREDFVGIVDVLNGGKIERVFGYPSKCLFKAQTPPLPNDKYDINDVSREIVRLSLPGKNLEWPEGNAAARQEVFNEHRRDQEGLLYFLQNDDAVPAKFREEARQWGWCKDEFTETNHLPPQLYVREARRMIGQHIYKQQDSEYAPGDARAVLHRDAIAMGDYGNNCHGTAHEGGRWTGKHTGEFYNPVPPYQIPYGVLVPKEVTNLLVPVAASSSHVGFCALRLEPIWMSLGQAAGHAAALANKDNVTVQKVNVAKLQEILIGDRSALIYTSDVPPGHKQFAAVQWWGSLGGLHGLAPTPAKLGQRGKNLHGQYFEAWPDHHVELDKVLDAELAQRWADLAKKEVGVPPEMLPPANGKTTRGEFIERVYKLRPER
jgi:hypothetical protein